MILYPILALLFTALEAYAIRRERRELEYIAKPAVILLLMVWLYAGTGWQGSSLWFGLGLLFSLLGDALLLFPHPRMFLSGLVAFLFTHACYLLGFKEQLLNPSAWSFLLMLFLLWNGIRLLRRIAAAVRTQGESRLVTPVILYGLMITLMLYAAMSTIFDPTWSGGAAFLVSAGAFLFWISDLMLAWNKFVTPLQGGRLPVLLTYHLGQISLIAGVIAHFG